jgi:opacity protein-like surface antigen
MKKIFFLFLFLPIALQVSYAQQGWEVGAWAGTAHYFGDLNTTFNLGMPRFATGLLGRYNFNNRLCLRLSGNYGKIAADDSKSKTIFERRRNINVETEIMDGSAQFEFNFLPYNHGSANEFFTPYLTGGFSVVQYNPRTFYEGKWVDLRPLGTEGQFKNDEYFTTTGAFTYGGGIKVDLSDYWSLNVDISARRVFTDYLDDVSGVYPDLKNLEKLHGKTAVALSDPSIADALGKKLGERGKQRGNSKENDTYVFFGIGVAYYFGDLKCPAFFR